MIAKGLPAESEGVKVNQLELHHWIAIAEVFDKWAFKPAVSSCSSFSSYIVHLFVRILIFLLFIRNIDYVR